MATSIKLIRRYVWLIETVRRHGRITQQEINRQWSRNQALNDDGETEIPERTFHRHREGAFDVFGVRIACDRRSGEYYIENAEILDSNEFPSIMFRQMALNNRLLENRELHSRVVDEKICSGEQWLSVTIDAIDKHRKLRIVYVSHFSGRETDIIVEPQFLKRNASRWYLIAKHPDGHIICYGFDRIKRLQLTEEAFDFDPSIDPVTYFDDIVGVNSDSDYECELIRIRVKVPQCNYLDYLPLHHSQQCVSRCKEYSEYEFRLRAEYEFQHKLLSMGENVEVMHPAWLRHQLFTFGNQIIENNNINQSTHVHNNEENHQNDGRERGCL